MVQNTLKMMKFRRFLLVFGRFLVVFWSFFGAFLGCFFDVFRGGGQKSELVQKPKKGGGGGTEEDGQRLGLFFLQNTNLKVAPLQN